MLRIFDFITKVFVKQIVVGAILGFVIAFTIHSFCDLYCIPLLSFLQSNIASWIGIKHWYIAWIGMGVIAKVLPW